MKKRRQTEDINTSEYVIRRPLFWPVFSLIMFLCSLLVCLLEDTPSTGTTYLLDVIAEGFRSIAGFSFFIPFTVIAFVILVINFYIYFRFKIVVHEQSFSVTPFLGATHEVAFSSVEKVTHERKNSNKGFYIDIQYDNKKIHLPYSLNREGTFKQKSIAVLLNKFRNYETNMTEDSDPFKME